MAELNYDEVAHAVYPNEFDDQLYRFETRFPERLSRLAVGDGDYKSRRNKASSRYRTQPITFDEIAEVDEDLVLTAQQDGGGAIYSKSQQPLQTLPEDTQSSRTSSDKENTPVVTAASTETATFPALCCELSRQKRRRRSFRKLRNRHSVPEEIVEKSEDTECAL